MIDLIISATVGAIAGSAIMRRIDLRKMAALRGEASLIDRVLDEQTALAEHARLADACLDKQARIDRALACETPKAAHGVKKMARLLRGEEA